jgi:hypothetical protein
VTPGGPCLGGNGYAGKFNSFHFFLLGRLFLNHYDLLLGIGAVGKLYNLLL